jgi:hypothetical protein
MKLKTFLVILFLIFASKHIYGQEIFKSSIKNYLITLTKNQKNYLELKVQKQKKVILQKTSPLIKLYFYNLDDNPEDELIVVSSSVHNDDTLNTLLIYTFEDKFKFCDSIFLGRYFPEFYQFDFDQNYFIKVYDYEIEKLFPSRRTELPFSFYYLKDCSLELDNENSFEEFEAEIDFLVDAISELKSEMNCDDKNLKGDLQRLLACMYVDLINSGKVFDFDNFAKKNYPCDDLENFLSKLKSIYESTEQEK